MEREEGLEEEACLHTFFLEGEESLTVYMEVCSKGTKFETHSFTQTLEAHQLT